MSEKFVKGGSLGARNKSFFTAFTAAVVQQSHQDTKTGSSSSSNINIILASLPTTAAGTTTTTTATRKKHAVSLQDLHLSSSRWMRVLERERGGK